MRGRVLGIESSCDETAAAVVEDGRRVLSSVVVSQVGEHAEFGGVVPEIAGRSHLRSILPVIDRALEEAETSLEQLDAIAVTQRPGLIGSLLVGLSTAKGLAYTRGLPLVGVNHIEAHAYAAMMECEAWNGEPDAPPYPCAALVVSGGHTALYRANSPTDLALLATTQDDAAGEAFDKVAHMLGLGYPGGPALSRLAKEGDGKAIDFPRYRAKPGRAVFSFSGLKTAVLYHLRGQNAGRALPAPEDIPDRADIAASFQEAAVDSLVRPTLRLAEEHGLHTVAVVGGVACNARLRERMHSAAEHAGLEALFPAPAYCTDNAVMIAGLGQALFSAGQTIDWSADASPR